MVYTFDEAISPHYFNLLIIVFNSGINGENLLYITHDSVEKSPTIRESKQANCTKIIF